MSDSAIPWTAAHQASLSLFPVCFMNVHSSGPAGVPVKSTFQVQSTKQSSSFPEDGVGHGLIT